MEPFAIVATVASIVQLAQAALTLSKTLYDVSSTIASAKEDIKDLADDLKTFSQSLTLLSRLLEDSKAWYSDDVYLLTAKIIRDCADLYGKIDKVLLKLAGNGKSGWKFRVKFVYKESQIRKLMERLRDMKGTLATILMSLQVDLQLSLLNISSSSKIQRPPEKPLHPETIQTLNEAQQSVEARGFLPRYTANAEDAIRSMETEFEVLEMETNKLDETKQENTLILKTNSPDMTTQDKIIQSTNDLHYNQAENVHNVSSITDEPSETTEFELFTNRSLKSSTSTESFKSFTSAISMQSESGTIELQTEDIKSIIHAFKVALETLQSLITKKVPNDKLDSFPAIRKLKVSLSDARRKIEDKHGSYCKRYGYAYIQAFADLDISTLKSASVSILKEIVTTLHIHSAPHQTLSNRTFEDLNTYSQKYTQETLDILTNVSRSVTIDPLAPDFYFWAEEGHRTLPSIADDSQSRVRSLERQGEGEYYRVGFTFDCYGGRRNYHRPISEPTPPPQNLSRREEIVAKKVKLEALKLVREKRLKLVEEAREKAKLDPHYGYEYNVRSSYSSRPCGFKFMETRMHDAPELTLPFIGYTFKRFEQPTGQEVDERDYTVPTVCDVSVDEMEKRVQVHDALKKRECDSFIHGLMEGKVDDLQKDSRSSCLANDDSVVSSLVVGNADGVPFASSLTDSARKYDKNNLNDIGQELKDSSPKTVLDRAHKPLSTLFHSNPAPESPRSTLWQTSFLALQLSIPETYTTLKDSISRVFKFDFSDTAYHTSQKFCENLAAHVEEFKENRIEKGSEVIEHIVNVMLTVHKQLGLSLGNKAWSCVYALLDTITMPSNKIRNIQAENKLLVHLLEMVGIIARYNVMENLYNSTAAGVAVESNYQYQLVELCMTIFTYFHSAFSVVKALDGGDDDATQQAIDVEEKLAGCEVLLELIRKMDKDARGFRILIELNKPEEIESEEASEESETGSGEDEDGEWERVDGVSRTNSELLVGAAS